MNGDWMLRIMLVVAVTAAGCGERGDPNEATEKDSSDLAAVNDVGVGPVTSFARRPSAPAPAVVASGPGWAQLRLNGSLATLDAPGTFVPVNEDIIVIQGAKALALAPVSITVKKAVGAKVASLPAKQQGRTIVVRKSTDDQVVKAFGSGGAAPSLLSSSRRRYSDTFSSNYPFEYSQTDLRGLTGNVNIRGTASGSVTAAVDLDVSQLCIPHIGCLSYYATVEDAALSGTGSVVADASANGTFDGEWHDQATIFEPTLYDDWVSVGGIPVQIKVTLPIDAGVDATAKLQVDADTHIEGHGSFDLTCTSATSCDGSKSATYSFNHNHAPSLLGLDLRAHVDPWAQASLKLSLYDGVAHAEVGVRATLDADFWSYYGNTCGDSDLDGVPEFVDAFTLDGRVKVDIKGNAGLFGFDEDFGWNVLDTHVGFWEISPSPAIEPIFYADRATAPPAAKVWVGMRPCWPYSDAIHYQIDWGDGSPLEIFDAPPQMLSARVHTFPGTATNFKAYTVFVKPLGDAAGRSFDGEASHAIAPRYPVWQP